MNEIPPMYKHQQLALDKSKEWQDMGLFFEMGCIHEDMIVTINRSGASASVTIKEAYEKVKNSTSSNFKVRGLVNGEIRLIDIKNIIKSGIKECILLTFEDNSILKCTPDHKLLTSEGWYEAKDCLNRKVLSQESLLPIKTKSKRNKKVYFERYVGEFHPYKNKAINGSKQLRYKRPEIGRASCRERV